jgi:hypothetical protein
LLLSIDDGVFEVLATAGDTHLGGEDFDNCVIEHFTCEYKKKTGTDVSKNQRAVSKLKKEVEKVKHTLSSQMSTKLEIESFENGNNFSDTLTRTKFDTDLYTLLHIMHTSLSFTQNSLSDETTAELARGLQSQRSHPTSHGMGLFPRPAQPLPQEQDCDFGAASP